MCVYNILLCYGILKYMLFKSLQWIAADKRRFRNDSCVCVNHFCIFCQRHFRVHWSSPNGMRHISCCVSCLFGLSVCLADVLLCCFYSAICIATFLCPVPIFIVAQLSSIDISLCHRQKNIARLASRCLPVAISYYNNTHYNQWPFAIIVIAMIMFWALSNLILH